ncbi:ankyrin repeat domain-containing protein [Thermodesulfobacteriota bacterium]
MKLFKLLLFFMLIFSNIANAEDSNDQYRDLSDALKDLQQKQPPLITASSNGDIAKVRSLLKEGANIESRSVISGATPLMEATVKGYYEICTLLIDSGADVNARENRGGTPVLAAAYSGKIEILKLLIKNGANVNARTDSGSTPLMTAAWREYVDIVKLLIAYGAEVNAIDGDGRSALSFAMRANNKELIKLLKDAGAK